MACGAQIVFPPLENPVFICGHCCSAVILCACEGIGRKDYVLVGMQPLPSQPTPVERLVRWAAVTAVHPSTGHFDARRFVSDMVDRNMIFTLALERSRLCHMSNDHARNLAEPAEANRLPALFAAGRFEGSHAAKLTALQEMCQEAMEKLVACDWAGMSPLEVALCQNAFQTSDPARYPLGDPGLQLVYDVIGVLTTVHRWAFSTRGWHLRLDSGADAPGLHHPQGSSVDCGLPLQLQGSDFDQASLAGFNAAAATPQHQNHHGGMQHAAMMTGNGGGGGGHAAAGLGSVTCSPASWEPAAQSPRFVPTSGPSDHSHSHDTSQDHSSQHVHSEALPAASM